MGAYPRMIFYKKMLDLYANLHYIFPSGIENQKTIVRYTTETLINDGIKIEEGIMTHKGIKIYPKEYFSPPIKDSTCVNITSSTYSIHYGAATWVSRKKGIKNTLQIS